MKPSNFPGESKTPCPSDDFNLPIFREIAKVAKSYVAHLPFFKKTELKDPFAIRKEAGDGSTNEGKIRILISDDEADVGAAIRYILEQEDYLCHTVRYAEETVKAVFEFEPDILMTDITKPHVDGLEVSRALRSEVPDLPIIIVTAHGSDEMKLRAKMIGVDAFIVKPFTPEVLTAAVLKVISERKIASRKQSG